MCSAVLTDSFMTSRSLHMNIFLALWSMNFVFSNHYVQPVSELWSAVVSIMDSRLMFTKKSFFVVRVINTQFMKKNATMYKNFIPYLCEAQHVSGDTPPIIRSLKLHWQPLDFHTWKVVGRVVWKTRGCQCSFGLLMMGGVSPETCWASYK